MSEPFEKNVMYPQINLQKKNNLSAKLLELKELNYLYKKIDLLIDNKIKRTPYTPYAKILDKSTIPIIPTPPITNTNKQEQPKGESCAELSDMTVDYIELAEKIDKNIPNNINVRYNKKFMFNFLEDR
jgi:hypothetical protein